MEIITVGKILLGLFVIAHLSIAYLARPSEGKRHLPYFTLMGRKISTGLLMLTCLTPLLAGRGLGEEIKGVIRYGWSYLTVEVVGYMVGMLILTKFVLNRFRRFKDCYTLSHIMESAYGVSAARVSRLLLSIVSIGLIVAQLVALADVAEVLDIGKNKLILLIGGIVILYALAGVRAVVWTDLLQMVILGGGAIWLTNKVLTLPQLLDHTKGGFLGLVEGVGRSKCFGKEAPGLDAVHFGRLFSGGLLYTLLWFSSPMVQRTLMACNKGQIEQTGLGVALFYPFLRFLFTIIGCGVAITWGAESYQGASLSDLFFHIERELLLPSWGILVLSLILLALVTTAIDSLLSATALEWLPLENFKKEEAISGSPSVLKQVRMIIVAFGLLSIGLALLLSNAPLWLVDELGASQISGTALMVLSLLAVPTIMAARGLQGNDKLFGIAIGGQLIGLFLFFMIYAFTLSQMDQGDQIALYYEQYQYVFLAIVLVGSLAQLYAHYRHYGRFIWEEDEQPRERLSFAPSKRGSAMLLFRDPLQWGNSAFHYARISPVVIGGFCLMASLMPNLMTPTMPESYDGYFLLLRIITLSLVMGLLCYDIVRIRLKRYAPLYWLFAIGVALVFDPLLTLCYNPQNLIVQLHLVFSLLLLMVLVDRQTWFVLLGSFSGVGLLVYGITTYHVSGKEELANFYLLWPIGLSLLYALGFGLLFIARKKGEGSNKMVRNQLWCQSLLHGVNHALEGLRLELETLNEEGLAYQLEGLDEVQEKLTEKEDKAKVDKVKEVINKRMAYARQSIKDEIDHAHMLYDLIAEDSLRLSAIYPVHIGALVDKACVTSPTKYRERIKVVPGGDGIVKVAPTLVVGVLKDVIKNAIWHGRATAIEITWEADEGIISITDNGSGIPADKLPFIFAPGFSAKHDGMGIGLAYSKMVIEGLHGDIEVASSSAGTTFRIKLPKAKQPILQLNILKNSEISIDDKVVEDEVS